MISLYNIKKNIRRQKKGSMCRGVCMRCSKTVPDYLHIGTKSCTYKLYIRFDIHERFYNTYLQQPEKEAKRARKRDRTKNSHAKNTKSSSTLKAYCRRANTYRTIECVPFASFAHFHFSLSLSIYLFFIFIHSLIKFGHDFASCLHWL